MQMRHSVIQRLGGLGCRSGQGVPAFYRSGCACLLQVSALRKAGGKGDTEGRHAWCRSPNMKCGTGRKSKWGCPKNSIGGTGLTWGRQDGASTLAN